MDSIVAAPVFHRQQPHVVQRDGEAGLWVSVHAQINHNTSFGEPQGWLELCTAPQPGLVEPGFSPVELLELERSWSWCDAPRKKP